MVTKKSAPKKSAPKKTDLEKKINTVKTTVTKEAKELEKGGKKALNRLEKRWYETPANEKASVIIGIVILIIGLYQLRQFVVGLIIIIIGILLVTGFFTKGHTKK